MKKIISLCIMFSVVLASTSCQFGTDEQATGESINKYSQSEFLGTIDDEIVGCLEGRLFGELRAPLYKESDSKYSLIILVDSNSDMKHTPMYKAAIEYLVFKKYAVLSGSDLKEVCIRHLSKKYITQDGVLDGVCLVNDKDENTLKRIHHELSDNPHYVKALEYLIKNADYSFFLNVESHLMGIKKHNNPDNFYKGTFIEMLPKYYKLKESEINDDPENVMETFSLMKDVNERLTERNPNKDYNFIKIFNHLETI